MLKVTNLSFSFPQKDLYQKVSFTIEDDQHCAFIGTNGTGKTTLIDMIIHPDKHLYDGKIEVDGNSRIGYVSQFSQLEEKTDMTVMEYLSEEFIRLQNEMNRVCEEMGTSENLDALMEEYQNIMDESNAVDADNYEVNIKKQLKLANLTKHENQLLSNLSGGEFKLIQVIREMMISPKLMIMDEPDVFLDFAHLNALRDLINAHKGTLLVITHNRYLLNHCFNKILHLENTEIQEFDGGYIEYNFTMLLAKIEQMEMSAADAAEIERNRKVVERMRKEATAVDSATKGRSLHARVSLLERLEARKTKSPFVDIKQPDIKLYTSEALESEENALQVADYSVSFDDQLLEHISFEIGANDKVAIVGENGTGKTTLLREVYQKSAAAGKLDEQLSLSDTQINITNNSQSSGEVNVNENAKIAYLSQLQGETLDESKTIAETFEDFGFASDKERNEYLLSYGFEEENINRKVATLSGGEKNILQLAKIGRGNANFLLLDEPTSHLDTYSQIALENAVADYNGAILMVSHDFYTVANCADYVLLVEEKAVRKVSIRKFRKMIYANHFNKDYLENEKKKKEIENRISRALKDGDCEKARSLSEELEEVIKLLA